MKKPTKEYINKQIKNFEQKCKDQSLPITPQKLEIYKILISTKLHPTANWILEKVQKKFPNLSFATVYKNLNKLKNLNLVKEITSLDGAIRYDADMQNHQHIINVDTKEIIDLDKKVNIKIPREIQKNKLEIKEIKIDFYVQKKFTKK